MSEIGEWRKCLDPLLADYRHAARTAGDEQRAYRQAKETCAVDREAQELLQHTAERVQVAAHAQIAGTVTHCLQTVFGEEYAFKIDFARKRGRTEAQLAIVKGELELDDPLNECGGGVCDWAAFALRAIAVKLTRPPGRQLLVLDESFRNVNGEENRRRTVELLPLLTRQLGVQMILATGNDWLRIGKVIDLGADHD